MIASTQTNSQEPILYKELNPTIALRVNLQQIVPHERLFGDLSFSAERHARQLFLRAGETVPPEGSVWMRVSAFPDHCFIELSDPLADDLEKCQRVFAQIFMTEDHVGHLYELAAPSFPGRRALDLVWNVMAIGEIKEMELVDGSMQLACTRTELAGRVCDLGGVTSLRMIGVFAYGKSWYERQGATPQFSTTALRTLFQDGLIDDAHDRRIPASKDFDHTVFQRGTLAFDEWQPSSHAYQAACQFLTTLPIDQLDRSVSSLESQYPLQRFREVLHEAWSVFPTARTVGDLVKAMMTTKSSHHALHHEFRDRIVSNKESVFFQFITDTLNAGHEPSKLSCILAWCVLGTIFDQVLECTSSEEACTIFCDLLHADDTQRTLIEGNTRRAMYKHTHPKAPSDQIERSDDVPLLEQYREYFLNIVESTPEIASVKVRSHSTAVQRALGFRYMIESGMNDEFLSAQAAIRYLSRLTMKNIDEIYPELFDTLHAELKGAPPSQAIGDLLASDGRTKNVVLDELLRGAHKHISRLFLQHLKSLPTTPSRTHDVYALFMIAKYICENHKHFALRIS